MLTTCYVDGIKISIADYKKQEGKDALCPMGHKLIAKRGKSVVHHFAHQNLEACDKWRQGLSNFHAQWQRIVGDKKNIEVCLDKDGNITGNSSFRGYSSFANQSSQQQSSQQQNPTYQNPGLQAVFSNIPSIPTITSESHIADIIRPYQSTNPSTYIRPLVVEIQNSSIDKASIDSREKYYQNMVWVFNFTPRVVAAGKHNKIVFVDGKVSYLKEKVTYVAMISSLDMRFPGQQSNNINGYRGDQCLASEPTQIYGIFIMINTRTKYWFETAKPTYFDCGYGVLRLIMKLDKGFALTLYMTYEEFCQERMPEINGEIYSTCGWFHSQNPTNLIKLNMLPQVINVANIYSSKEKLIIYHNGNEFQGMGLERGKDSWHWFDSYNQQKSIQQSPINQKAKESSAVTQMPQQPQYAMQPFPAQSFPTHQTSYQQLSNQQQPNQPSVQNQPSVIISNPNLLISMMTTQMPTTQNLQLMADPQLAYMSLINKVRTFLGVSANVNIEVEKIKGSENVVVYCNKETYGMQDKFKTLGMKYFKVTSGDKRNKAKINKSIDNAVQTTRISHYDQVGPNQGQPTIVGFDSYKTEKLANAVMTTNPSKGSFYHVALKGFEDKLNKLV